MISDMEELDKLKELSSIDATIAFPTAADVEAYRAKKEALRPKPVVVLTEKLKGYYK